MNTAKLKHSLFLLLLPCMVLTAGCQVLQHQPKPALITPSAYQAIGQYAAQLIKQNYRPDQGVFAFKYSDNPDNQALIRALAEALRLQGYAVQEILPEELRQQGDARLVDDMQSANGALQTEVKIWGYSGTQLKEVTLTIDNMRYACVFRTGGVTAVPSSAWSRFTYPAAD